MAESGKGWQHTGREPREWSTLWHHPALDVRALHAYYITQAFPRHSHDYYVICLIERGLQSFTHGGTKHLTLAGGVILLNPGAVHTGEAASRRGFEYRALYPTVAHMQVALVEYTGHRQDLPFFAPVPVMVPAVTRAVRTLHHALTQDTSPLECESRFLWTLAQLVGQFADTHPVEPRLGHGRRAVQQACECLRAHVAERITLTEVAAEVGCSPYYLLRLFRREIGMPPHAYLESVRIRHAQALLTAGVPLVQVALDSGFSSQSHLTNRFKRVLGVTPGQYAQRGPARRGAPPSLPTRSPSR
jgi:AraC-like DNA-binding protein